MAEHILVTPDFGKEKRQIVEDILASKRVAVNFLASASGEERKEMLQNATVMLTFNPADDLSDEEFDMLDQLRFIQLSSAGADHLPYRQIPSNLILASNSGAYAEPIAEHVVGMTLCLAKRLREEHQNMVNGDWNQFKTNRSIRDSTIGILGFGGIGQTTARRFRCFGSRIFAMNTSGKSDEPTDFIGTTDDLQHILESSDVVVISLPLNKHTRELIGKEQLGWMKEDAILINVARGEIINQKALYQHLKNHPEFKAALESWWVEPQRHGSFELEYPLLDLTNVLASPHNSAIVPGIMEHGLAEAAKNIKNYLNGDSFKGKINREDFV